jgi:hypothetical protein
LLKLLEWERRTLEEADRHRLIIRWSKEPGWISLHDPLTGEAAKLSRAKGSKSKRQRAKR